jgi:hypothetical protein
MDEARVFGMLTGREERKMNVLLKVKDQSTCFLIFLQCCLINAAVQFKYLDFYRYVRLFIFT